MVNYRGIAVLLLVFFVLLAKRMVHQRLEARRRHRPRGDQTIPAHLTQARPRTWVLFTTPYCTTCSKVEDQLRASDPRTPVMRVDASEQVALAERFAIRTAPTLILAGADGSVLGRYVGATDAIAAARAASHAA